MMMRRPQGVTVLIADMAAIDLCTLEGGAAAC